MRIFDCFIYFDEDLILDLRLRELNKYIDKFIIVESGEDHQGNLKKKKILTLIIFMNLKIRLIIIILKNFQNL